ncbi:IclR family transcriptional regulator [Citricoccus sp. SGAir0253]|uniref:IclR family transcriptional regulator n=1 Tax=Citricoccus sp. SGAir0253 TaxID=2567881 RepID=UPI0010CCFC37|nr:IclR family transcriptional regulator [Citricoccus sp. SGAir0253]QCU77268.1 IclR family transcriptional regulator [Citricoccus sp. SGAir0253]
MATLAEGNGGPDAAAEEAEAPGQGGVQSVDRAISVMEILSREGRAGVSEIADELGIHKSTASRLLAALVHRGLVQQDHDRGKYQLGFGILRLAASIPGRLNLVQEGGPILRDLATTFRETANLAVLRSGYAVNVDQALGPATLASQDWIGSLTPLHATASGKVLLAGLPTEERQKVLKKTRLPRFTSQTITSRTALETQLLEVARTGLAFTDEEYEIGLCAVAVPVRDHLGHVIASLSVSGPGFRFSPRDRPELLETLQQAGLDLSWRMGYSAP